jgi:hypothetical protein
MLLRPVFLLALALSAACVPPRERLDGASADGSTLLALDLRPTAGDSVSGAGILQVAGRPRPVVLRGYWNGRGDGLRKLEATVQATVRQAGSPAERWALEWSPSFLHGSLRSADGAEMVALSAR